MPSYQKIVTYVHGSTHTITRPKTMAYPKKLCNMVGRSTLFPKTMTTTTGTQAKRKRRRRRKKKKRRRMKKDDPPVSPSQESSCRKARQRSISKPPSSMSTPYEPSSLEVLTAMYH